MNRVTLEAKVERLAALVDQLNHAYSRAKDELDELGRAQGCLESECREAAENAGEAFEIAEAVSGMVVSFEKTLFHCLPAFRERHDCLGAYGPAAKAGSESAIARAASELGTDRNAAIALQVARLGRANRRIGKDFGAQRRAFESLEKVVREQRDDALSAREDCFEVLALVRMLASWGPTLAACLPAFKKLHGPDGRDAGKPKRGASSGLTRSRRGGTKTSEAPVQAVPHDGSN